MENKVLFKTKQQVMRSQPIQIRRVKFQVFFFAFTLFHNTHSIKKRAEQG